MSAYKIYYQQEDGYFRILDSKTNQITVNKFQPSNANAFALFKGYDASDDGIHKFHYDFKQWCKELRYNKVLSVEYAKYYSHHSAVELTFKRLCKGKWEHHDPISINEGKWSDMCNNGGLMFCTKGVSDCYGYDAKAFYPSILASDDFKIPSKQGNEVLLDKLPLKQDDIKCGYYKVKITCDNSNFTKLFAFSQHHVYTHLSIKQAMMYKRKFNVSMELIQNGKPNAYIYDDSCLIPCSDIFGSWYDTLNKVKSQYPKNKLVKHLLSSVWGHLSRTNKITKSYQQVIDEGLNIGRTAKSDYLIEDHHIFPDKEYYVLVHRENPYKFPLRLKSFITSYGRNQIAQVALLDIDNIIRIQTDGIIFNKPTVMIDDRFIAEEKTTGRFDWQHVNKGVKLE